MGEVIARAGLALVTVTGGDGRWTRSWRRGGVGRRGKKSVISEVQRRVGAEESRSGVRGRERCNEREANASALSVSTLARRTLHRRHVRGACRKEGGVADVGEGGRSGSSAAFPCVSHRSRSWSVSLCNGERKRPPCLLPLLFCLASFSAWPPISGDAKLPNCVSDSGRVRRCDHFNSSVFPAAHAAAEASAGLRHPSQSVSRPRMTALSRCLRHQ